MPQLISAAMIQGLCGMLFRCPYQANVMNTLLRVSSARVVQMGGKVASCEHAKTHVSAWPPAKREARRQRAEISTGRPSLGIARGTSCTGIS